MLLPKTHETHFKISPAHSWTTLHCQEDRLGASDVTLEGSISPCNMLPSRLVFTKSVTVLVAVSKMEVVFINHRSESQWTVGLLLRYLTISTNVRWYYLVVYKILSFSKTVHRCILHSTQFNCCTAKLSTSFLLSYGPTTAKSLTPLTTRFRKSYGSMNMNCK